MQSFTDCSLLDVFVNGGAEQLGCIPNYGAAFNLNTCEHFDKYMYVVVHFSHFVKCSPVYVDLTFIFCSQTRAFVTLTRDYEDPKNFGCQPIAVRCASWGKYEAGLCSNCTECGCALAGLPAQIGEDEWTVIRPAGVTGSQNVADYFLQNQFNFYYYPARDDPYCGKKPTVRSIKFLPLFATKHTAYNYIAQVTAEAQPGNVGMVLQLLGQDGNHYTSNLRMDISSHVDIIIPANIGQVGPFFNGRIVYFSALAALLGTPFGKFFSVADPKLNLCEHFQQIFSRSQCISCTS